MAQNLTFTALQSLKPRDRPYKVTDGGGLFAEVLPTGSIVWRYQFLLHGKRSKVTLGKFRSANEPKSHVEMTLEDARDEHRRLRALVRKGENPAEAKQADKKAGRFNDPTTQTVADLFGLWLGDIAGKRENTQRAARGWWENDIKPAIGQRYINTVKRKDVESLVAKVERRGSPASAEKVAMTVRQCYAFGIIRRLAKENPAINIIVSNRAPPKNHRPLEMREIGPFLRALDADGGREENKLAIRLLMLTLVRKNELRLARWDEIDLDNRAWTIPGHRMKMDEPHTVYLSTQAASILGRLRELAGDSPFVLHHMSTRSKPIGHTTLNNVIDRIDFKGSRFVPHGFRATASTLLNERGFRPDVIEKALAHGERNKVRGAYNRATYAHERSEMLQWWADYLDALETGKNVIPIRFGEQAPRTDSNASLMSQRVPSISAA